MSVRDDTRYSNAVAVPRGDRAAQDSEYSPTRTGIDYSEGKMRKNQQVVDDLAWPCESGQHIDCLGLIDNAIEEVFAECPCECHGYIERDINERQTN